MKDLVLVKLQNKDFILYTKGEKHLLKPSDILTNENLKKNLSIKYGEKTISIPPRGLCQLSRL